MARLLICAALSVRACRFSALTRRSFSSTVSALDKALNLQKAVILIVEVNGSTGHVLGPFVWHSQELIEAAWGSKSFFADSRLPSFFLHSTAFGACFPSVMIKRSLQGPHNWMCKPRPICRQSLALVTGGVQLPFWRVWGRRWIVLLCFFPAVCDAGWLEGRLGNNWISTFLFTCKSVNHRLQ